MVSDCYTESSGRRQHTCRLQAGTANKETVDIGLLGELAAVLLADGATVDDAGVLRSLGRDGIGQPLADGSVNLLSLLSGSDLTGSNGPRIDVLDSS